MRDRIPQQSKSRLRRDSFIHRQGDRDNAPEITAFWKKLYIIENHYQTNISKGRRGKGFNTFMKKIKLYTCHYNSTKIF